MKTITIVPEINEQKTIYRALCGQQQAIGTTPGQALDEIDQILLGENNSLNDQSLVILQRFHPDNIFTLEQQTQMQKLMENLHNSMAKGEKLSDKEQQELEQLIELELAATIERGNKIIEQI